jgi:type II secretory pathway component GspD/PulD (secretin)
MDEEGFIDGMGEHSEVPFAVVSEERTNSLVIMMDRRYQEKAREILARLDVPVEERRAR